VKIPTFAATNNTRGADVHRAEAEIIPIEPDAGNAVVGKKPETHSDIYR
jgi:hypothetical protein